MSIACISVAIVEMLLFCNINAYQIVLGYSIFVRVMPSLRSYVKEEITPYKNANIFPHCHHSDAPAELWQGASS